MNLILTSTCNKNCSFCFAKDKGKKEEMPLEEAKALIRKISIPGVVKLLGGEPTLYSYLPELLRWLEDEKVDSMMISNFLKITDETKEALISIQNKRDFNFLLNTSEMTESQTEKVKNNIDTCVVKKVVAIGFTIDVKRSFESYEKIIDDFLTDSRTKDKINSIRLSVPFPSAGNHSGFYLYKKYEYIDYIIKLIKYANKYDLRCNIDCGLFPCMFRNKEDELYVRRHLINFDNRQMGCTGLALDVYTGGKSIMCYPANYINADSNEHDSFDSVNAELDAKKDFYTNLKRPDECIDCSFFESGECAGPCLGFIKPNKQEE